MTESTMNEIESLYYSYLSLGQYDDLAGSMVLFSLIMVAAVMLFYIIIIDGDTESKNAESYFNRVKMLCAIGISLFILSAVACLYFSSARSFTRVEIEKQCVKVDSTICEKLFKK